MKDSKSHLWAGFAAVLLALLGPCAPAVAQDASTMRAAADEAKFRVISRFPGQETAAPAWTQVLGLGDKPVVDDAVREAIRAEKWSVARLLVSKQEGDEAFAFLSGYLAHRDGDHAAALAAFEGIEAPLGPIDDYRWYYQAKSAFAASKFHEAALYAAKVPSDSLLLGDSLVLLADALLEAGQPTDVERAMRTLELYLRKFPRGRVAEQARLLLGDALREREAWDAAAEQYVRILDEAPLSSEAGQAKERLASMREHLSKATIERLDNPPKEAVLARLTAHFDAHRSEHVIETLAPVLEDWEAGSAERCEALYMVAKSYTKLRRHADSMAWYERLLDECPSTSDKLRALYLGGKGLWNAGRQEEALEWFERIWTEHADHSFADDALYFAARILREEGKGEQAEAMLRRQVDEHPGGDMAKDAHWLVVRGMFERDAFEEIVAYIDALGEATGEDDVYSRGRLAYFRGRALERSGDAEAAAEAYRQLAKAHPLSYYALLALNRLGRLSSSDRGGARPAGSAPADLCGLDEASFCAFLGPRPTRAVEVPETFRAEDHFTRGAELLRLGLAGLAEREFRALRRDHAGDLQALWALSYLLDAAGAYTLSHDLPRRHIDGWQTDYPTDGDDPRWRLAFPRPFPETVADWATKRAVAPELVWAFMREESGFNPQVESWANARGLLQLMEPTAEAVARADGLKDIDAADLFDAKTNVRLGTAYIAELAGQLGGHPLLVIAGYNAGHANVARWLGARGSLPVDLWIEDIPYGQTRRYTKRVATSWWTYAWLYGDARVPRLAFDLPTAK